MCCVDGVIGCCGVVIVEVDLLDVVCDWKELVCVGCCVEVVWFGFFDEVVVLMWDGEVVVWLFGGCCWVEGEVFFGEVEVGLVFWECVDDFEVCDWVVF